MYCRGKTYHPYTEICCGGELFKRQGHHDACCHGNPYASDRLVCCNGLILPKTTAGCDIPSVCRLSPIRFLTKAQACCGGVLYPLSKAETHGCCKNVAPFKYDKEICCSGTVHPKRGNDTQCCGTRAYQSDTQLCCAGEISEKTRQGCPRLNATMVDICKKSPGPRFFPKAGYGCCGGQVRLLLTWLSWRGGGCIER